MNVLILKRSHRWMLMLAAMFMVYMTSTPFCAYGDVGAMTPFKTYEAEDGALGGGAAVLSMTTLPAAPTVQLESSGRACVELNAIGESVTWTNTATCNAFFVRASIPDSLGGGGLTNTLNLYVDGVFRQTITLTSTYSWIYGVNGFTNNNPAINTPKRFYDTVRGFIASNPVPAGSTIMLRKDVANTADYYRIDLIHLENVGPALPQPPNTLSVTNYLATPNDSTDDSTAFKNCITACQSQGKGMWIPAGVFRTQGVITANGIDIYGAGMWHTINQRVVSSSVTDYRHKWDLTDCTIQDLYIDIPEFAETNEGGHDYGMTVQGANGWTVQRVWVHRSGAAFWCSGTDGTIKDCRSTESWADGINLNNSGRIQPNYRGLRLTCTNNYIIGSGDDGIAINSQNNGGTTYNMVDTKVVNNTSIAVNWANGIRIAGGRNSLIQNNLITDPTDSNGIRVGQFGTTGNPCESVLVSGNLILRGCGIRTTYGHGGIAVTDTAVATIESNTIIDSPGIGIDVQDCSATFTGNIISHPFTQGFLVKSGSTGTGLFTGNTVSNLNGGQVEFQNNAPGTFTATVSGNSWQGPAVTGVTVAPETVTVAVTGTQQLTATVSPTNAASLAVNWTTSDPFIAVVDSNGLVTAISGGTATITATTQQGLFTAASEITVVAANDLLGVFQAESADFGGASVTNNNEGYHGTGFLDFKNLSGDYVTWTVTAPSTGPCDLTVRYALSSGSRPLSLTVNGTVVVASLDFPVTGSWTNWATVTSRQTLIAGTNTITLTAIGLGGGNFDELSVVSLVSDYAIWAAQNPGIDLGDPDADYDGDGVSNDHERLWGLNPADASSRNSLTDVSGLAEGSFSYTRRTSALSGYSYSIWTSTNLFTWVEDAGAVQTPGAPVADVELVDVQLSPAPLTEPTLFVRVRAVK